MTQVSDCYESLLCIHTVIYTSNVDWVWISNLCWFHSLGQWGTSVPQIEIQRSSTSLLHLFPHFLPCLCCGWDYEALGLQEKEQDSAGTSSCIPAKPEQGLNIRRTCHMAHNMSKVGKWSMLRFNVARCIDTKKVSRYLSVKNNKAFHILSVDTSLT